MLGIAPLFGLDPETREGTRFVGPFCAVWFAVAMGLFFTWVKDPVRDAPDMTLGQAVRAAGHDLRNMWKQALGRRSLIAFLTSSMFYRDSLVGLYAFGGIYAKGVLGWSILQVGTFGILGVASAGLACWLCGSVDRRFGPKPVIVVSILVLLAVSTLLVGLSRESLFAMPIPEGSNLPDQLLFISGALIGAAGGTLQSSSRSLMVRHADPERPTESFGLYALTGKATAFVAPFLINVMTNITGDQRLGVSPLIVLFLLGLVLLAWVKKEGDI